MIYLTVLLGIALISALLAPFFLGQGGLLAAGSSINSPDTLRAMKAAILKRYVEDEAAFAAGDLSRLAWDKRRQFLINRYVDTARRLDFVTLNAEARTAPRSQAEAPAGARVTTSGGHA